MIPRKIPHHISTLSFTRILGTIALVIFSFSISTVTYADLGYTPPTCYNGQISCRTENMLGQGPLHDCVSTQVCDERKARALSAATAACLPPKGFCRIPGGDLIGGSLPQCWTRDECANAGIRLSSCDSASCEVRGEFVLSSSAQNNPTQPAAQQNTGNQTQPPTVISPAGNPAAQNAPPPASGGGKTLRSFVEGDLVGLVDGSIVPFMYMLAFLFFIYGIARSFFSSDEEKRKNGRQFALWGIIGLAVLFTVWGLVKLLLSILTGGA